MRDVIEGNIVSLECLGDFHSPEHRFLDSITERGTVKLSPGTDPPFTGAHWECVSLGGGALGFASAGAIHGLRYLDGRTQDGFVQTVGDTLPPFSGTRWQVREVAPGVVTIMSLGDFHNPEHRFLDGHTQDGSVGIAPSTDGPFSGTKWGTRTLPNASLDVRTTKNQLGADLQMVGSRFTPGDTVHFAAEGIVGHGGPNHAPTSLASATVGADGAFDAFARVDNVGTQPPQEPVTIRATDAHGRSATDITFGFNV